MKVWLKEVWQSWRASLRRPGFLLLATGVLALGVAATVGVFTLIDNVLMQPLPYAQPAQLVSLGRDFGGKRVSPRQYQRMAALSGISSLGLYRAGIVPANVTGGGKPEQVRALDVDHGLLPTLGVKLLAGRNFNEAEDRPHGPRAVILGYGFWQRRFGGDLRVVGRDLALEGKPYTIVGVLPASFDLFGGPDILLPTALPADSQDVGTNYMAVARMAPGTRLDVLSAELTTRMHAMYAAMSGKARTVGLHRHYSAVDLRTALHAGSRTILNMFLACALLVLLVALINLVNLMVLRAMTRSHDGAVRVALGASGVRLALPALAEGILIGVMGAVAGLGLAVLGLVSLQSVIPVGWLGHDGWRFGVSMWGLAFAIGLGVALLAAALGIWRSRIATTIDELREGGRNSMNRRTGTIGKVLVMTQLTLATALLVGAGLFMHTLYRAANTPLGFSAKGVLTFELAPIKAVYPDVASVHQLDQRVLEHLRAQPGVVAATVATNLPVGGQLNLPVQVAGNLVSALQFRAISPAYFATYGVPVRSGRVFAKSDGHGAESVAVVNQAFAQQYFAGHALGKTVQLAIGKGSPPPIRIVGVVGDTHQYGPLQPVPPVLYVPLAQMPDNIMAMLRNFIPLRVGVRVRGAANDYRNTVQQAVNEVAPQQPIANMRTLASVVRDTTSLARLDLLLVGLFALLAMLLASAGMYAVMAVSVAAREREFGVRLALGAAPMRLVRLVLRGGLIQVAVSLATGVLLGWILTRVLRSALEQAGQAGFAPSVVIGVCVVLAVASLLACLLPALRAARVQPMQALRGE